MCCKEFNYRFYRVTHSKEDYSRNEVTLGLVAPGRIHFPGVDTTSDFSNDPDRRSRFKTVSESIRELSSGLIRGFIDSYGREMTAVWTTKGVGIHLRTAEDNKYISRISTNHLVAEDIFKWLSRGQARQCQEGCDGSWSTNRIFNPDESK